MVRWESVVIATFGAVGGIALGVFLGWALVQAVGTASGGLGVFALPADRLGIVVGDDRRRQAILAEQAHYGGGPLAG